RRRPHSGRPPDRRSGEAKLFEIGLLAVVVQLPIGQARGAREVRLFAALPAVVYEAMRRRRLDVEDAAIAAADAHRIGIGLEGAGRSADRRRGGAALEYRLGELQRLVQKARAQKRRQKRYRAPRSRRQPLGLLWKAAQQHRQLVFVHQIRRRRELALLVRLTVEVAVAVAEQARGRTGLREQLVVDKPHTLLAGHAGLSQRKTTRARRR